MKSLICKTLLATLLIGTVSLYAENTAPKLVVGELPDYPEPARIHNTEGTVVVEALVDETGKVFAADVVESVSKELDKAAVAAVMNWKFDPAIEDGKPVMKVVQVPLQFNLVDPLKEAVMSHNRAIVKK